MSVLKFLRNLTRL